MAITHRLVLAAVLLAAVSGCQPKGERPGLWLSGETAELPSDWSFSEAHKEIGLEIRSPYLLPHSVTIWCAAAGSNLYVAARNPESKRWPGWVEKRPEVRLKVGDQVYEAKLARLDDDDEIKLIRLAYRVKYGLPDQAPGEGPPMRYWQVEARE